MKVWIIGFLFGMITPGKIGDLYRTFYLKRDIDLSTGKSLTTVVFERLIDIATLFSMAALGLLLIISNITGLLGLLAITFSFFIVFLTGVIFLSKKGRALKIIRPLYTRLTPIIYRESAARVFHDFYAGMKEISRKTIILTFAMSIICWLFVTLQYYLFSLALGIGTPISFLFAIVPVVALLDALPISFSGIGTRDAALVLLLSLVSVTPEAAISLSLLVFIFNYITSAVAGVIFWIKDPIGMDTIKKKTASGDAHSPKIKTIRQ